MIFENEKEFEFNVWCDLKHKGISVRPVGKPFDLKIDNTFIEFKICRFDPIKYHEPEIRFTKRQTQAMRKGIIPIVLACADDVFYFLPQEKIKELIERPGRKNRERVWITAGYFGVPKISYEEMIKGLVEIIHVTPK